MSLDLNQRYRHETGFSLVELMVGMTLGFIAMVVIVQTLSVFEAHKRTTTGGADAQENGLLALMAIEADIRKAGSGFNHPAAFDCQNFFSHYQFVSGTGAPVPVGSFMTVPVLIDNDAANKADTIRVHTGLRFTGSVATQLSGTMDISDATKLLLAVERPYDFIGEPPPLPAAQIPADLIMVVHPDYLNCSLMQVTSNAGGVLSVENRAGKAPEYNPTRAHMIANNWPGFGTRATENYPGGSLIFRVGATNVGGIKSVSYTVNANNSLEATITSSGAASTSEILSSEIVALQAQYGVAANKTDKTITSWENPSGATWSTAALTAVTPAAAAAAAITNRQRIKAIRVAVVARSSVRDGALVTSACTENNAVNFGPCSWTDDSAAKPAPAIDLRAAPGDTEWQHYRYKVYQTVIPMRNVLWPELNP